MNDVRKVIADRWTATEALAGCPLHYDQAPSTEAKPHCVFRQLPSLPGDRVLGGAGGGVDRPRIQFQAFAVGADVAGGWAAAVIAAFDGFVAATAAGDEVKFYRDTPELTAFDSFDGDDQSVFQSNVIYDLFVNRVT